MKKIALVSFLFLSSLVAEVSFGDVEVDFIEGPSTSTTIPMKYRDSIGVPPHIEETLSNDQKENVSPNSSVTSIVPYSGFIDFSNDADKSAKKKGVLGGIYFSHGDLTYLVELDYIRSTILYKDSSLADLEQNDITFLYSRYFQNFFVKGGLHHINTTDEELGDGNTYIFSMGGYNWSMYDKYSYGVESFYSVYNNGHDDDLNSAKINILQLSPNFTYSKAIDTDIRNNLTFRVNYINANKYDTKNYFSYEVEDTLYYHNYLASLRLFAGRMKTGVKDGGNTIFNTKDLLKSGGGVKLGYYFKPTLLATIGFSLNRYTESGKLKDTSNTVLVATLKASF